MGSSVRGWMRAGNDTSFVKVLYFPTVQVEHSRKYFVRIFAE
jgi:hypothetical protein